VFFELKAESEKQEAYHIRTLALFILSKTAFSFGLSAFSSFKRGRKIQLLAKK